MRTAALAAVTTAAALVLAGCGNDEPHPGSTPHPDRGQHAPAAPVAGHNQADITFARNMIPHHVQAVEMAGLAGTRAQSSQVKDLALRIETAQGPEISTLRTWLRQWGAGEARDGGPHDAGHGQPDGAAPAQHPAQHGMMAQDDMVRLAATSGAEFDRLFLELMIQHHEGAVAMAGTELAHGTDADATALARRITDTQRAEIEQMRTLLGTL